MFNIGMFSYMCMAVIPIFCRPYWPKKIIRMLPSFLQRVLPSTEVSMDNKSCTLTKQPPSKKKKLKPRGWTWSNLIMNLICLHYVAIQLFLPYSHFLTKVKWFFLFCIKIWHLGIIFATMRSFIIKWQYLEYSNQ